MEITRLKLSELEPNAGQIPGLPTNPRQWTKTDVDKLARSLKETPELFEARPIIVTPHDGKYIILGGNLRYEGARTNKDKDAPCIIIPEGTPIEKMKEIVIKDNGSFGAWDFDMLGNEWDDLPLADWGVPAWNPEEEVEDFKDDEKEYSRKIEAPIYKPTEGTVKVEDCVGLDKYKELVADIDAADIPKDVKGFLRMAATRHIVFDYAKIADYYANAPAEVQELMEKSALVIIDFGKAIEQGFIKMSEELRREYMRQQL